MEFLSLNLDRFIIIYILLNLFSFFAFYIDKRRAVRHLDRITEKNLLLISFFAPMGSVVSMLIFKHKTKKIKFKMVYAFLIIHLFLGVKLVEILVIQ